jgi:hypothetical protein
MVIDTDMYKKVWTVPSSAKHSKNSGPPYTTPPKISSRPPTLLFLGTT